MKNKMLRSMSLSICLGILALFLFFSGCATSKPKFIITMNKAYLEQLYQNPPAVIVLVPEKRIEFAEFLFRGLWNETRENYYSFEGIWDPATTLGENFVKTLQENFGLETIPLWEKLESENYQKIVAESEAYFNTIRKESKPNADNDVYMGGSLGPCGEPVMFESSYLEEFRLKCPNKYLKGKPLESVLLLKEVLDIDYIFELAISGISVYRHLGKATQLRLYVYGRLIRLSDGAVIWLNKGAGWSMIGDIKEFSELERNNLELLKTHFEKAVTWLFDMNECGSFFFKGIFLD